MAENTQVMPGADRDEESGKYTPKYPTEAFVDAVANADGFAGTQDVADAVGCSYESAYKKLRALEDDGRVKSQKVASARVWTVADDAPAPAPTDATAGETREDHVDDRGDDTDALVSAVVDAVATGWDADGRLDDRKAAARAVLAHAVETGEPVGKSEAVAEFRDDYPVAGQEKDETWWRQNAREALSAVGDYSRGFGGYSVDADDLAAFLDERDGGDR